MTSRLVAVVALLACAAPSLPLADDPARHGPYSVELLDEDLRPLPAFRHRGRSYALGTLGRRYLVRVRNGSWRRAEVVVSVDGRDVVDGRPASWAKRGYVVEPQGEVTIDGYRLGESSVAAFRFASVRDAYASRLGDARDVGVVGVAVFPERERAARIAPPPGSRGETAADAERSRAERGDAAATKAPSPSARPGLGTEFGEEHHSEVRQVHFQRAAGRPEAVLVLRYDDRRGLLALGVDVDRRGRAEDDAWLRATADPFRGSAFAQPPPGWQAR
jgi:hypothetical protein